MRMIRLELVEFSKKLSLLTRPPLRGSTEIFSKKEFFEGEGEGVGEGG
jgi:hypothetical protein